MCYWARREYVSFRENYKADMESKFPPARNRYDNGLKNKKYQIRYLILFIFQYFYYFYANISSHYVCEYMWCGDKGVGNVLKIEVILLSVIRTIFNPAMEYLYIGYSFFCATIALCNEY